MRGPRSTISAEEDFAAFYQRHERALVRFLARQLFDPEVAIDLAAETFAQAFVGRHRFRGTTRAEEVSWLETIARRRLSRYWRRGKAERQALTRLGIELPRPDREELERVEELASLADARAAIQTAIANLSADHRQALELRIVRELPYPEVAQALGVSEQTARARVSRGLKALARSAQLEIGEEGVTRG